MRLDGLVLAVAFMTRLPVGGRGRGIAATDLADAAPWLPATGIAVGSVVVSLCALGAQIGPAVGALLGLVGWVAVTGALHLDGLGDSADAAGAAHGDPTRYIAVLKDPNAGNFAVAAIALQLIAKTVLLAAVVGHGNTALAAVVLAATWARFGALVWASALAPLGDGLAARMRGGITRRTIFVQGALLLAASLVLAPALVLAPLVIWLGVVTWRRGPVVINGDGLGALIEVTESVLMLAAAAGLSLGFVWL
ncbi:MAG: adenosylcobinamide-GDP ribazoletransferase [Hyphomicrobiaceae bacterium]